MVLAGCGEGCIQIGYQVLCCSFFVIGCVIDLICQLEFGCFVYLQGFVEFVWIDIIIFDGIVVLDYFDI